MRKFVGFCLLSLLFFGVAIARPFSLPKSVAQPAVEQIATRSLRQQARQLYERGDYLEAIALLQKAVTQEQLAGNSFEQGLALSNLSLVYQAVGQWQAAESAIAESLALLNALDASPQTARAMAGTWESRSQLQSAWGKPEASLESLEAAMNLYAQLGDETAIMRVGVNQSFVLQEVGRDRAALQQLLPLLPDLLAQPDSLLQATAFRSLGNVLRVVGDDGSVEAALADFWQEPEDGKLDDIEKSRQLLQHSLEIAQRLQLPTEIARAHFSLGNTERGAYFRAKDAYERNPANNNLKWQVEYLHAALAEYRKVERSSTISLLHLQAQLNTFSLLIEAQKRSTELRSDAYYSQLKKFPNLLPEFAELPPSRSRVYAEINFVESLLELGTSRQQFAQFPNNGDLATLMVSAIAQSQEILHDERAESYATGMLGKLYETQQQWGEAQEMTQKAILLAEAAKAPDIGYQWQWQLGRVLRERGEVDGAIAAYEEAIASLDVVRQDLLSLKSRDVRFLFRDDVEPVYRELVDLLLRTNPKVTLAQGQAKAQPEYKKLNRARRLMEQLQVAELEDYLRCNLAHRNLISLDRAVDRNDSKTAVIYPIVLKDRLDIILKLPNPENTRNLDKGIAVRNEIIADSSDRQNLMYFSYVISAQELEKKVEKLRSEIEGYANGDNSNTEFQSLHRILLKPLEAALESNGIKTLIFVLDNSLKNLPIAALYDGKQYLLQKYNLAVNLGLEFVDRNPFNKGNIVALAAGVSQENNNERLVALPFVIDELTKIESTLVGSKVLLDKEFTSQTLQQEITSRYFPILHLATHGKFSSSPEETIIWAYEEPINLNQLENLLQRQQKKQVETLELIVLSACETATGDRRAMLGMAGVAFQVGAKSTIGSLFKVNDESTQILMTEFYRLLTETDATIAEALRHAQRKLLENYEEYENPYYWSPYLLVGNWR